MKLYFIVLKKLGDAGKLKVMELDINGNASKEDIETIKQAKVKEPDKLIGITDEFESIKINLVNISSQTF